jgi:hypothetical protein
MSKDKKKSVRLYLCRFPLVHRNVAQGNQGISVYIKKRSIFGV